MPERRHPASIAQALEEAAHRLRGAGVEAPRREATALWAGVEVGGSTPGDVWLRQDSAPGAPVVEAFWRAVGHRVRGVPIAYAVGRTSFRTLELRLDPRALIPRPETEGLLDLVLDWCRAPASQVERRTAAPEPRAPRPEPRGIAADVGTGSGCIALSLAVEGCFERVVAVERSAGAAALARENVALVAPPVPVEVIEGDLLAPLAARGERYRVIVSNPPYLTDDEYGALDPAVKSHEPGEALASGPDGLAATRALLAAAPPLLERGGMLALEIDERRADAVCALASEHGWRRIEVRADLFGRPRYALVFPPEDA